MRVPRTTAAKVPALTRVTDTRPLAKYDSPRAREEALTNRRTAVAKLRGMISGEEIDYIRAVDPAPSLRGE